MPIAKPRLLRASDALSRSDRLFAAVSVPDRDAYAATHADPSYTFIMSEVVLKYRAPATRALPSLSVDGSFAFCPRYRSSKLSKAAKAASLDACALEALEAAAVALVDAAEALLEAEVAEFAALVSLVAAAVALLDALVA